MRKLLIYIVIFILVSFGFQSYTHPLKAVICPDTEGGILTAEDSTRCTNEPTILTLTGSEGQITWLSRISGINAWTVITGETDTIITVYPDTDREYAALLTGSCTDTSSIVLLQVSSFAQVPNPGFGGEACGYYFSLSAFPVYNPLNGYWTQVSGPDLVEFYPSSKQADPDSVTTETIGSYQFAWNITDGICTKDSVIDIEVLELPVADPGSDTNQCGRTFNMNAKINIENATGEWYKVSGAGTFTFIDKTAPNTTVYANPGTYQVRWTERNSTCEDDTIIEINVADSPVANAGITVNSCNNSSKLNAYPSIGLGNWTQISGPGTIFFNNSNLPDALVSASDYGEDFKLLWKEVNSFCSDSDTVIVNFYEQPTAKTESIDNACGLQTDLSAWTSTTSDYVIRSWTYISGPAEPISNVAINDSTNSIVISPEHYGEYIFRWKEVNGTCSDSVNIPIRFFQQPIASAGKDIFTCGLSTQLMAESNLENSIKRWYALDDSIEFQFSDVSDPLSNITSPVHNTFSLVWEEINHICLDVDTVEVSFYEIPDASPGNGGDTCGLNYSLNAIQSVSGSTGNWSMIVDSDTSFLSNSKETITQVDSAGKYSFLWTENNKGCIDQKSIEVTFFHQPNAAILEAGDACGTEQILKTVPTGNNQSAWNINSEDGDAEVIMLAEDKFKVIASDTGKYLFNWKLLNEKCTDDTSFTIQFYQEPEVSAGEDIQTCGNSTSLNAFVNLGSGSWTKLSGPGIIEFTESTSPSSQLKVDEFGTYTIQWSVQYGACLATDSIKLDFVEPPSSYAGADEIICNLKHTLSAYPSDGYWAVHQNKSNLKVLFEPDFETANAIIIVDTSGILSLNWISSNKSCTDSSSVTLNFLKPPIAKAGPDQELDNVFETTMQAEEPSDPFEGIWSLISGSGIIKTLNSPLTDVYDMDLGKNTFQWKVKNDYCEASDTVQIEIFDIFIPEVITPNGDNENDYFVIRGIENTGPVDVTIFNRWGIEVYHTDDYQNDWGGTNKNGNLLTNDTYFYAINIADKRIFKGFVVIKK